MTEDLDCPKCGSSRTEMKYMPGVKPEIVFRLDACKYWWKEHFHRKCFRCEYSWATDDVGR